MGIFEDDNHLFAETKEAMFGRPPWPKEPPTVLKTDPPYDYTKELLNEAPAIRTFDTGATRDTATDKLDYEGFLSPLALQAFAKYMHENRKMKDGSLRDSDNWQKGIPLDSYASSMFRHFMDVWMHHRGYHSAAGEAHMQTALCALLFNVMGYLHTLEEHELP